MEIVVDDKIDDLFSLHLHSIVEDKSQAYNRTKINTYNVYRMLELEASLEPATTMTFNEALIRRNIENRLF